MLEAPIATLPLAPFARPRRTRQIPGLRRLVRETHIPISSLVQPLFVQEGLAGRQPVPSMPGIDRFGLDALAAEARELQDAGLGAVILFGLPTLKDATGSAARDPDGIVPRAIQCIKDSAPGLAIIADTCLCAYTNHGQCGILRRGEVQNDATLSHLAQAAVAQAEAGADVVAPSAMMDGQVAAIRAGLDAAGLFGTPILAYSAKYASGFYGPFRDAADSAPVAGDRSSHQLDPANLREAMREIQADIAEGSDMVLVKPALPCLDVISQARERFDVPLGAYQVSGEYAMIKAAVANGWIDEQRVVAESLLAIRRAGSDFTITYYAKQFAQQGDVNP